MMMMHIKHMLGRYIGESGVSELPPEIGDLTGLIKLNMVQNALRTLPPQFTCLTRLEWLWLGSNALSSVPTQGLSVSELRAAAPSRCDAMNVWCPYAFARSWA